MIDATGSNDRRSPSLSPRKGNHRHPSSSAFRQNSDRDLLRPESASLLPQGGSGGVGGSSTRRPPTFDGISVVAVEQATTEDATPSKRLRNRSGSSSDDGGGAGGGGEGNKRGCCSLPAWAGGALHLTTAVVGVGIHGLPRALVDLGWPGGIAFMGVATAVSLYTALLLVELCSSEGGGGDEGGGVGGGSSAGGGETTCSRSPPPPPPPESLLPTLHPLPPSSILNGSGIGRRGSNQDLQSLTTTDSESTRRSSSTTKKKRGAAAGAGGPGAAATTATAAGSPHSLSSGGGNRYETYGALARATLGPRVGGAVASMQLLACAGCVFRKD